MSAPLVILAAGGTGGHMFPAEALACHIVRAGDAGWRVALATDTRGLRYAGAFPVQVTREVLPSGGARAPHRVAHGILSAWRWMRRERPVAVVGFGGYPSVPVLAAARLLGIPAIVHEQNAIMGRVNRFFASKVAAVALGFPLAAPAPGHHHLIGNPVRDPVLAQAAATPPGDGHVHVLAFGGSQGAQAIAELVPAALAALPAAQRARLRLVLQCRPDGIEAAQAALSGAGITAEVASFFDDLPARMARADLVIARSGASTVAELTTMARPAILIPYPHATDDHQTANARFLADKGAAVVMPEASLTPAVLQDAIGELVEDPARMAAMARAAAQVALPDAAADLDRLIRHVTTQEGKRP